MQTILTDGGKNWSDIFSVAAFPVDGVKLYAITCGRDGTRCVITGESSSLGAIAATSNRGKNWSGFLMGWYEKLNEVLCDPDGENCLVRGYKNQEHAYVQYQSYHTQKEWYPISS